MPLEAPVTIATFPPNLSISELLCVHPQRTHHLECSKMWGNMRYSLRAMSTDRHRVNMSTLQASSAKGVSREMRSLRIFEIKVVRFNPSLAAAPLWPPTTHFVCRSVDTM